MEKRAEFNNALKESIKEKNQVAVSTIRLILAALKERDIEARSKGQADGLTETEILSLMQSMIKQRQESVKTYVDAGRTDLADREAAEIQVIKKFLPEQMSEEDVKKAIHGLIEELGVKDIKDMGKLMAALKSQYAGKLDMARASAVVKEALSA